MTLKRNMNACTRMLEMQNYVEFQMLNHDFKHNVNKNLLCIRKVSGV